LSGKILSINTCPLTRGRQKGGKGRDTYKLNIKNSFTNNTNNINKRNKSKHTKLILSFPELGAGAAAGQHQAVLDWPRQQTGTGLRNAQIGIQIRIAGGTTSRVHFRGWPQTKRARPS